MVQKNKVGLAGINVTSGTAMDSPTNFRGFVTVEAVLSDRRIWQGQLSPTELRKMAMQFLEVAEAAEQDATVFTMLTRDLEMTPNEAGAFVRSMRNERIAADEAQKHNTD